MHVRGFPIPLLCKKGKKRRSQRHWRLCAITERRASGRKRRDCEHSAARFSLCTTSAFSGKPIAAEVDDRLKKRASPKLCGDRLKQVIPHKCSFLSRRLRNLSKRERERERGSCFAPSFFPRRLVFRNVIPDASRPASDSYLDASHTVACGAVPFFFLFAFFFPVPGRRNVSFSTFVSEGRKGSASCRNSNEVFVVNVCLDPATTGAFSRDFDARETGSQTVQHLHLRRCSSSLSSLFKRLSHILLPSFALSLCECCCAAASCKKRRSFSLFEIQPRIGTIAAQKEKTNLSRICCPGRRFLRSLCAASQLQRQIIREEAHLFLLPCVFVSCCFRFDFSPSFLTFFRCSHAFLVSLSSLSHFRPPRDNNDVACENGLRAILFSSNIVIIIVVAESERVSLRSIARLFPSFLCLSVCMLVHWSPCVTRSLGNAGKDESARNQSEVLVFLSSLFRVLQPQTSQKALSLRDRD